MKNTNHLFLNIKQRDVKQCDVKQRDVKQRGFVLFVALIALVAMSLAAAALIRSVDTTTGVAGNLAFKQSATLAADYGVESAFTWVTANALILTADKKIEGYHATNVLLLSDPASTKTERTWFKDADLWDDANSRLAEGNGFASGKDSVTGNTVRYIVQRMCNATGDANESRCLYGSGSTNTSSLGVKDDSTSGAIVLSSLSPMYRVTARVVGPKNTVSYVQAFIN